MGFFPLLILLLCFTASYSKSSREFNKSTDSFKDPHPKIAKGGIGPRDDLQTARLGGIRFDKRLGSKWENRRVPYVIADNYTIIEKSIILTAISLFNQQVPCLKFNQRSDEEDYVYIINGNGCNSHLGRTGGKQPLSLQYDRCLSNGAIWHEMFHTLGAIDEQNRPDRDDHIKMLPENIPAELKSQYEKANSTDFKELTPYDYASIMHLPRKVPGTNKDAFTVNNRLAFIAVGQRVILSRLDIDGVNAMYC